jgi:Ni/Fe-hydrogenase 1 B-type cytochrome subunit
MGSSRASETASVTSATTTPNAPATNLPHTDAGAHLTTVYVWDLPVRITHWVNVAAIVVLSVTGYYIATPFVGTHGPATDQFLMGTVRFSHFTVAFVFTTSVLFRVYWAFVGNKYARWSQFLPATSARRRALVKMLGYYTFVRRGPPAEVGHNPLAGVTYIGLYVLFALQIATGCALYAQPFHDGLWKALFGWMIVAFGAQPLRLAHDLIMYLILAFTIHHVYSAVLIDSEEQSGLLSSIVTGRKALTTRHVAEAAGEDARATQRGKRRVFDDLQTRKARRTDV